MDLTRSARVEVGEVVERPLREEGLELLERRAEALAELRAGERREEFTCQVQAQDLGHREHQLVALDERGAEFPELLAEVAFLEVDGEPDLPEYAEVPLDLPLGARKLVGQLLRPDTEPPGLKTLEEPPLPDERFTACHGQPSAIRDDGPAINPGNRSRPGGQ